MIGAFSSKGGSVSSVSSDAASCGAAGVVTAVVSAGFFSCANMPLTQNSGAAIARHIFRKRFIYFLVTLLFLILLD